MADERRNRSEPTLVEAMARIAQLEADCDRLRAGNRELREGRERLQRQKEALARLADAAAPIVIEFRRRDPSRTVDGMPGYCPYLFKNRDLQRLSDAVDAAAEALGD